MAKESKNLCKRNKGHRSNWARTKKRHRNITARKERRENNLEHPILKGFWRGALTRTARHGDLLWPHRVWHPKKEQPQAQGEDCADIPYVSLFCFLRSAIFGRLMHHVSRALKPLKCHDNVPQTNTHGVSATSFLSFRCFHPH